MALLEQQARRIRWAGSRECSRKRRSRSRTRGLLTALAATYRMERSFLTVRVSRGKNPALGVKSFSSGSADLLGKSTLPLAKYIVFRPLHSSDRHRGGI